MSGLDREELNRVIEAKHLSDLSAVRLEAFAKAAANQEKGEDSNDPFLEKLKRHDIQANWVRTIILYALGFLLIFIILCITVVSAIIVCKIYQSREYDMYALGWLSVIFTITVVSIWKISISEISNNRGNKNDKTSLEEALYVLKKFFIGKEDN